MVASNDLNISQSGFVSFDGISTFNGRTFTAGAGINITNGDGIAGNPVITNTSPSSYISLSPYIVGPDAHSGFATIASAIAQVVIDGVSATNPKNIYIKPQNGGYTENLTLVDGINLIGFGSSYFNGISTTKIIGKITMTATGTASVTGLGLQTNGDYVLEITGANSVNVILNNCTISATNASALHCTNTTGGIQLFQCNGIVTGANTYFVLTGGSINADYCILTSSSTTASTFANANCNMMYTYCNSPITTSGTGSVSLFKCQIITNTNATCLTHGGSGNSFIQETRFESGTASAVSIGATLPMMHCSVFSTNANAITGAGTLQYAFIAFYGSGSSSTVNTAVQTALATLI